MSTTTAIAARQVPERFEHRAVFREGPDALVEAVLPFVRQGVGLGEPVLVALLPDRLSAIEQALGADATRVDFVDMRELGANPACIIPEWRRFVDQAGVGTPVRGVGEPVWSGRRDVEIEEAAFHEELVNLAFDGGPPWRLMCAYDASVLPAQVLDELVRSHQPAPGDRALASYAGPEEAWRRFSSPLPPPPRDAEGWDFGALDLAGLRSMVARIAAQAGVRPAAADDLVLAAHELATNSVRHGGGTGHLSTWTEPGALVVEVSDRGVIDDPLVGRDLVNDFAESGRGVWMANQLCDLVQVRSGAAGTVVRLFVWL